MKKRKVRITFRSVVFIEGKDLKEIKQKWENMELFSSNENISFVEVSSVEDADGYKDIKSEFNEA